MFSARPTNLYGHALYTWSLIDRDDWTRPFTPTQSGVVEDQYQDMSASELSAEDTRNENCIGNDRQNWYV